MTGPFIFIATNRLKQRKLASEKERLPDFIDFIHTNEPRLIAFNEYANEEGTKVAVVQVHSCGLASNRRARNASVRFDDGTDAIVGGSRVER